MKEVQFIFDGGFGNQLFQFFGSKYIKKISKISILIMLYRITY